MMTEKHIASLLYRYQCVTVPGFGAFLTEHHTARLDTATGTFYPPKKVVSFNANLKNNDGLLANHIAVQEKISYEEAVEHIGCTVAGWVETLTGNAVLTLKTLGSLAQNQEGSLVFTPDIPVNYLTDAFGLSAIVSPAVKREVYKEEVEALEAQVPVLFTPERRRSYPYLKYAAVFALVAGAGTFGFKEYRDVQVETETLAVQQAVQEKVQNQLQTATFFIDNPMPSVKLTFKDKAESYPYHVIAGAFQSEDNADTALNNLLAKGYKAIRLEKNKYGLYPVTFGSYATHDAAQEAVRQLHQGDGPEAWILIQ